MKTSVIFLALSLSTAASTLGQSASFSDVSCDLYAVGKSAATEPEFLHPVQPSRYSDRINGAIDPTNVVHSKTLNAAIYPVINSMKVRLALENPQRISLRFRLLNERGDVLYAQRLPRGCKVSMQYFDLERMQDGTYTLEVSDGVTRWPLEFQLRSSSVVVPQRVIALH